MNDYIITLENEFRRNTNPIIANGQKAYMKNHFEFLGLKSPIRKKIQKPFLHANFLPPKDSLKNIIKTLWLKPEREFQYFAQEFALKYHKQLEETDIELMEFMVTHKSWWDTVDFIASNLMGEYFKKFPMHRSTYVEKWLASDNMWLQRSSILFQLKYKNEVDTTLLAKAIHSLLGSKEFFINKAIGWALRQYSKTNPTWVINFANQTALSNLSRKEALRLIGSSQ